MLRLNDEGAWTFLTTPDELRGFEENQGTTRPKGVQHGAQKERVTWKEAAPPRSRASARTVSPLSW